jgi:hypothetical protein
LPEQPVRPDLPPCWTVGDLAAHLKRTNETILDWHREGKLPPAMKVGRHLLWSDATIRTWLASLEGGAA